VTLLVLYISDVPLVRCYDPLAPEERARVRKEWDLELREHEQLKLRIREEWDIELQEHERVRNGMKEERDSWEREREQAEDQRKRERDSWEQERKRAEDERKREAEDHRKSGMSWADLTPEGQCLSYGTREYTARLVNIPAGYDGMKACMDIPIAIHGVTITQPRRCDDRVGASSFVCLLGWLTRLLSALGRYLWPLDSQFQRT
jgi:hypothetical protein